MELYHFTALDYLPAIAREGLTTGEVPVSATDLQNGVWLTTQQSPNGHGLSDGRLLTDWDKRAMGIPLHRRSYLPGQTCGAIFRVDRPSMIQI